MKYLPILGGLVLIVYSIISLVQIHAKQPVDVTIEQLEKGEFPEGEYVRVKGGWSFYVGPYSYKGTDDQEIHTFCHPLFSEDDPFLNRLESMGEFQTMEDIPRDQRVFKVMVRTTRFDHLNEVPDGSHKVTIEGTVSRGTSGVDIVLEEELRKMFPKVDQDEIIMVAEDERPGIGVRVLGIIAGVGLIITGIVLLARGKTRAERFPLWQQPAGYRPYPGQPPYPSPQQPPHPGQPPYPPQAYPQQPPYPPGPQGPYPPQREGEAPPPDFSS